MSKPLIDRRFQFVGTVESSSTDHPRCDQSEESFDLIQPGTAGWGEVKEEAIALLGLQPALDIGAFMRAVVVHNEMDLLFDRQMLFEMIQKTNKLAAAMAFLACADHFPIQDIERGKQSSGAMAFVVVCLSFRQAGPQRQDRRGAV